MTTFRDYATEILTTNMISSALVAEVPLLEIFARVVKTDICVVNATKFTFVAVKRTNNFRDIATYRMVSQFV